MPAGFFFFSFTPSPSREPWDPAIRPISKFSLLEVANLWTGFAYPKKLSSAEFSL